LKVVLMAMLMELKGSWDMRVERRGGAARGGGVGWMSKETNFAEILLEYGTWELLSVLDFADLFLECERRLRFRNTAQRAGGSLESGQERIVDKASERERERDFSFLFFFFGSCVFWQFSATGSEDESISRVLWETRVSRRVVEEWYRQWATR
jgi:hypothetical protein